MVIKTMLLTLCAFLLSCETSTLLRAQAEWPSIYNEASGVGTLDLVSVARATDAHFVAVRIAPDLKNPTDDFGANFLKDQKRIGSLIQVPTDSHLIVRGDYTVEQELGSSKSVSTGTYYWTSPMDATDREGGKQVLLAHLFSRRSDSSSSYFICRLDTNATGSAMFQDVHPIPASWTTFVMPAVLFIRRNPNLWLPGPHKPNTKLKALLRVENPFIVVAAVRSLCSAGEFTHADMGTVLSSSDAGMISAAIATVVSVNGPVGPDEDSKWLLGRIQSTTSMKQLEGITVGASAAQAISVGFALYNTPVNLNPLYNTEYVSSPVMMDLVKRRLQVLDPTGSAADPVWNAINLGAHTWGGSDGRASQ